MNWEKYNDLASLRKIKAMELPLTQDSSAPYGASGERREDVGRRFIIVVKLPKKSRLAKEVRQQEQDFPACCGLFEFPRWEEPPNEEEKAYVSRSHTWATGMLRISAPLACDFRGTTPAAIICTTPGIVGGSCE